MTRAERLEELRSTLAFYGIHRHRHVRHCGCIQGDWCPALRALMELETETRARLAEMAGKTDGVAA